MSKYKQSFMKGTLILLAAGIINRILGFVPRITLPRIIGAEGVGLYQMGYPFLYLLLTIITGGIPLAIAKLVAEAQSAGDEGRVRSILRVSLRLTSLLGVLFTAFCFLLAPLLTKVLFTDQRVMNTFLVMSPILLVVSISSVYRGYFQGRQNMIPSAASTIVETIARIIAMLILSYMLLPYGMEYAAAGAMTGVLIGEICGLVVILTQYLQTRGMYVPAGQANDSTKPKTVHSNGKTLRELLHVSIPVTASRLVGSASYFLESIFIVQSLAAAGIATASATAQYGALQGMIMPILLLPGALTYSLSTSLVPNLSEAAARGDMATIHKRLHQSIRLAVVTGAPFAVIMFVLAEPLCYYLYKTTEISVMLKMMAMTALFIYVQAPLNAALQALDRPGTALINSTVGTIVKLTTISLLASKPHIGILGAVVAININIMLVTVLHWSSLSRQLKFYMKSAEFFKVGLAMLLMGIVCLLSLRAGWPENDLLRFLCAMTAGVLVYLIMITLLKLIDRHDLKRLPVIGKRI